MFLLVVFVGLIIGLELRGWFWWGCEWWGYVFGWVVSGGRCVFGGVASGGGVFGGVGAQITAGTDDGSGSDQKVGYTEGGLTKMEGLPYAFGRFGLVLATRFYLLAGDGGYWSGSTVSSAFSFLLDYNGSELYPAYQSNRYDGRSVRCVAR